MSLLGREQHVSVNESLDLTAKKYTHAHSYANTKFCNKRAGKQISQCGVSRQAEGGRGYTQRGTGVVEKYGC